MMARVRARATVLMAAWLLVACSSDQRELRTWMDEERAKVAAANPVVDPPKSFDPFHYEGSAQTDLFAVTRIGEPRDLNGLRGGGVAPDMKRRREPLEAYPLDVIQMVGTMADKRSMSALLQADRFVYQARVGAYVGQNFGQIVKITETEVVLNEIVQDAAGDWVRREAVLRLQEGAKK